MLNNQSNRDSWNTHYLRDKSRLSVPDENVVRFIQHFRRSHPEISNPAILEIGSGSGRHLTYLRNLSKNVYGMDFALNALEDQVKVVCARCDENPFREDSFDIIIAWGVLHYLTSGELDKTLDEVRRILKPGGVFFGTIRSDKDTHLRDVLKSGDLKNAKAMFYSESEALNLFKNFRQTKMGFIMRQHPGESSIVAHHVFEATT